MAHPRTLVLGGVRSGKSRLGETLAQRTGLAPTYVATARCLDEGMRSRIALHRDRRGPEWQTIEEPIELASTIARASRPDNVLLIDCLSMWVTNLLLDERDLEAARAELVATLGRVPGTIVMVGSETSLGVLPMNELARRFLDECGLLHQAIAAIATDVCLVVAGLPLWLKRDGTDLAPGQ